MLMTSRLISIDWQPTTESANDDGLVRRPSAASSFHSAGHDSGNGIAPSMAPIPEHDFTAGPALAPVGGYADLARGPSPQPTTMTELSRGPSLTKGYDQYGVPLHHGGGYGGTQVGGVYDYGARQNSGY